jgi:hypothetical protein
LNHSARCWIIHVIQWTRAASFCLAMKCAVASCTHLSASSRQKPGLYPAPPLTAVNGTEALSIPPSLSLSSSSSLSPSVSLSHSFFFWQAVILNLTVHTELTKMFKLNQHVCEVQLMLLPLVDLLVKRLPALIHPQTQPSGQLGPCTTHSLDSCHTLVSLQSFCSIHVLFSSFCSHHHHHPDLLANR